MTGSGQKLTVQTSNIAKHNTYTVSLKNAITHTDGSWNPTMTFVVTVLDPCRTTAINAVDVAAGITLQLGNTATLDFLEAVDAVETSSSIKAICGPKSYVVVDSSDVAITWISIAKKTGVTGTYTITAAPVLESFIGANNYKLWTTLDNYKTAYSHAGRKDTLVVTVQDAVCDCSGVVRDPPALVTHNGKVADGGTTVNIPVATINEVNSKAVGPKIRKCYPTPGCSNAATFVVKRSDNSNLPSFLVNTGTAVTVTPLNGDAVGEHLLRIVMTPTYGTVQTYDMLKVVITCTIASVNDVAAPTTGLTYTLYATTHSIDLS